MANIAEAFTHHMAAIGVISVRWASVERVLYDILQERLDLVDCADRLRHLNAGISRLEYFRARLKVTNLTVDDEVHLKSAVDCLMKLYDDRNSIAHGQYGIIASDDGTLDVSWSDIASRKHGNSSTPHLEPTPVTVDDLRQHAEEVYKAAAPLREFLYRRACK